MGLLLVGCVAPPPGVAGERGRIAFQGETDVMFTSRLVVGSHGVVRAVDRRADNDLDGATVVSSDKAVAVVEQLAGGAPGTVSFVLEMVGPGAADIVVQRGDDAIDSIHVEAAKPLRTELVDGALLALADVVDARLPGVFGVLPDGDNPLLVTATDRCGGSLLDLHASALELDDPVLGSLGDLGPAGFHLADLSGDVELRLVTPGLEDLTYDVRLVTPGDVDEVHAEVCSVDTGNNLATLWGRAFVDDMDVIGVEYDWSSDPRVTLESARGISTKASIFFPDEGEPPDDRPANVTAEVFGQTGSVDLLALTSDQLVAARDAPPLRAGDDGSGTAEEISGCGTDVCDPFVAGLLLPLMFGRRRRAASRM